MFPKNLTEDKNKNERKQVIMIPYPQREEKKDLNEKFFEKFLEIFRKLGIKIHFFEALEQMPLYQQFMKDNFKKENIGR